MYSRRVQGGILDSRFRGNDELYPLTLEKTLNLKRSTVVAWDKSASRRAQGWAGENVARSKGQLRPFLSKRHRELEGSLVCIFLRLGWKGCGLRRSPWRLQQEFIPYTPHSGSLRPPLDHCGNSGPVQSNGCGSPKAKWHRCSTFRSCMAWNGTERVSMPSSGEIRTVELTRGREAGAAILSYAPWHFLYFFPLPQGQGSLRPTLSSLC